MRLGSAQAESRNGVAKALSDARQETERRLIKDRLVIPLPRYQLPTTRVTSD